MISKTDIESILTSLRMAGLEPCEKTMAMIEPLMRGEITAMDVIANGKVKYTMLGQEKYITLAEAFQMIKDKK